MVLRETRWTFTGKTSQSVDTEELAVVLFGLTFIKVFARLCVLLQDIPPGTRALVTSLSVLADEVAWFRGLGTFIKIYTRGAADVCGVAHLAEASERAHGIDALTVAAKVWHNLAFIDISAIGGISWAMRTYLLVLGSSRKWAELTLVTPASPPVTAAFGLCDEIAAAGRHLTHGL